MKTICIIGGGISGIVSAKHCVEQGYNVILLEKNKDVGGVWYNKTYPTIQLQTTKKSYAFSDFPHKPETQLYPNGIELMEYIKSYINYYNLYKYMRFNCEVTNTKFINNEWIITYLEQNIEKKIKVNFLIVASGVYSNKNEIYQSSDNKIIIKKKVLTVEDIKKNPDVLKNKKVVIIGNGPTGCDIANLAYKLQSKKIVLLYRSDKWLFRRFLWNKISADCFLNRFAMYMANKIPNKIFIIIISIFYYVIYIFGHKYFFLINTPKNTINRNNIVLNDEILHLIYNKKIEYLKSVNTYIYENYININYTKNIEYDIIINATGYKTDLSFLSIDNLPNLYKNIIHPDYNNCGFIGFSASFNWIQVSELQVLWYLKYIKKNNMVKEEIYKLINNNISNDGYNSHDLAIKSFDYCDDLSNDLHIKKKYNRINYSYWFSSPEHNLWSKYNE